MAGFRMSERAMETFYKKGEFDMLLVHYPKCSTCQKARKWLEGKGLEFEERDIKNQNPSKEEIRAWHQKSGLPLKKFFNTSGMIYREMGLKDKLADLTEEEQYELLASDGMLVKRPILVTDAAVLTGFRKKEWESLL